MYLRYILLFSLVLLLSFKAFAQERCATHHYNTQLQKKYPSIAEQSRNLESVLMSMLQKKFREGADADTVVNISVVVHVIHNTLDGTIGGPGNINISNEQIFSQIEVLNEDYRKTPGTAGYNNNPIGADTKINFCLAAKDPSGNPSTSINRIYTQDQSYDAFSSADNTKIKSFSHWPAEKYLNLYVVHLAGDYLGYAQYPYGTGLPGLDDTDPGSAIDGVVIDFQAFGRIGTARYPYNLGRTATHEIGHWLGLRHIWGDTICGDDYVADTPIDEKPNQDNDCIDSSFCIGRWTQDLSTDYLDYSKDYCMNIFTLGQKERMRTALKFSPRLNSIINHSVCEMVTRVALQEQNENFIKIFPNPCSGIISYEIFSKNRDTVYLEICNSMGQKIYRNSFTETDLVKGIINLQEFEDGLYILNMRDASTLITQKIILKK